MYDENADLYDSQDFSPYNARDDYPYAAGIQRPLISTSATYISIILCCLPLIYHILYAFNYDIPPLPQILFNSIVSVIPPRLLYTIEKFQQRRTETPAVIFIPRTHAAKREAMRRVLGMDKPGGIISAVGQVGVRRLSVFQGLGGSRKSDAPMGLGNIDNSCYQNSILQGLASLDSFSTYLEGNRRGEQDVEEGRNDMGFALKELITELNDPSNNGKRRWTPSILKNMNSMQQQDAQEYYSGVLDAIEKEKAKELAAAILPGSLDVKESPKPKVFDSQLPISDFKNPLEGMTGQRVSCKSCGHSDGIPLTPFNCLTVPLARIREQNLQSCLDEYTELEFIEDMNCVKCTLIKFQALMTNLVERTKEATEQRLKAAHEDAKIRLDAINEALEDDDYEDKTLREKCKIESKQQVKSTKTRQTVIARPSKSLVIHFNRSVFDEYAGRFVKNYSKLWFPEYLDLSSWCLGSSPSPSSSTAAGNVEEWLLNPSQSLVASSQRQSRLKGPLYRIKGVVTHEGHHEDGHYICYRKQPIRSEEEKNETGEREKEVKEQWWRLSDSQVRKAPEEEVFGERNHEAIFMLFYECVDESIQWLGDGDNEKFEMAAQIQNDRPSAYVRGNAVPPSILTTEDVTNIAASMALPTEELEDIETVATTERRASLGDSTTTTTTSESDIEELTQEDVRYQPVQPIVIAPYVPKPLEREENESSAQQQRQRHSVMV